MAAIRMLTLTNVVAVVLLASTPIAAQPARETSSLWAFRKPVILPPLPQPGFVELRLDPDVYRDAQPTLADLRLRDPHGVEVGYALRRRERVAAESARDVALHELVTSPSGVVRVVLDAGPGRLVHNHVRLRIREQARNFRVPVGVETADDGRTWQPAREAGFIYRVGAETGASDTSVAYPSSTARWLRVTIGSERGRPLPLAGATLVAAAAPEREEERVAAAIAARDEETMRRTTRLVVEMRARRPVDRVELDVAERDFRRVVLLEAGDDGKAWRGIASFPISAVDAGAGRERLTGTRFPETTARYLRLTIQNLDEPAVTVTGVRVFAVKRTLVFEATPGRAYLLHYGHPSAPAPRYETGRALAALGGGRLPQAALGGAQRGPAPAPAPWLASRSVAAWTSMVMAGLALTGLLWRMARAVRARG
jgi:hypothetical protein